METILVHLQNPHHPDRAYPVVNESGEKPWRCYINPSQISFMQEIVKDDNLVTQVGVGNSVFEIDCTLDSLRDLINAKEDIIVFK